MKSIHAIAKVTLLAIVCSTLVALSAPAVSAQGGKVIEVILSVSPQAYDGPCPATINFIGKITTDGPATVQYTFARNDSASAPTSTLVFDSAGTKEVSTTWTLGGGALPSYHGWQLINTLAPNKLVSNKAYFKLLCKARQGGSPLTNAQPAANLPNLVTKFSGLPGAASAGDHLGDALKVQATNIGGGVAGGTLGSGGDANGYMIDLVLSRKPVTSTAFAIYSPNYSDGVLLQGGRISRTGDLGATAYREYTDELGGSVVIPADTPSGNYYFCAVIDPGNRVRESNETDNISCQRIKIKGRPAGKGEAPPE
ncbi:MAG: hypothetical protein H0U54_13895 [Acidobacteria bacterium]|nr:hypothetical protein [Acidobacteriota bacterium]